MSKFISHVGCFLIPFVATALFSVPVFGTTVPGGGSDGMCMPQVGGASNGVTTCLLDEGLTDTLTELVVNFTGVTVVVNSVTPGPITGVNGDADDWIIGDPIGAGGQPFAGPFGPGPVADCTATPTLLNGQECTFEQSFVTNPGDAGPLKAGESLMSFTLGITPVGVPSTPCAPAGGQVVGPTALGLLYCFGVNPGTNPNVKGSLVVTITSADITLNDLPGLLAPEPGSLALLSAGALVFVFWKLPIRKNSRKTPS